jgi:protein SMG8
LSAFTTTQAFSDPADPNPAATDNAAIDNARLVEAFAVKLDPMGAFCHQLCSQALPAAIAQYQAELPEAYRKAEHLAALAQAVRAFRVSACGPQYNSFLEQLVDECERSWRSGRQLCEAASVSGGRCCLPAQPVLLSQDSLRGRTGEVGVDGRGEGAGSAGDGNGSGAGAAGATESAPAEEGHVHTTGKSVVCTCLCGKLQKEIEEPFRLADANVYFVEEDCCAECITQSHMHLVTTEEQEHIHHPTAAGVVGGGKARHGSRQKVDKTNNATRSGALFDESALEELLKGPMAGGEMTPAALDHHRPAAPIPALKCCKVGARSDYVPSTGLKCAGFIAGTNFMLPWDVMVARRKQEEAGGSGGDGSSSGGGGAQKGTKKVWKSSDKDKDKDKAGSAMQTTRCYVGYEYECPRGCRFMDASPDRRVQQTASGYAKGTALPLLKSNMPLFVACPGFKCSRSRNLAQLSRLHLVTPKTAVKFGFIPRIQLRAARSSSSKALVAHAGTVRVFRPGFKTRGCH